MSCPSISFFFFTLPHSNKHHTHPTGSRRRDLIGSEGQEREREREILFKRVTHETPNPQHRQVGIFMEEGIRAPVTKATCSRHWRGVCSDPFLLTVTVRDRERERKLSNCVTGILFEEGSCKHRGR